eukprot:283956-Prymnesium_polylepis.1
MPSAAALSGRDAVAKSEGGAPGCEWRALTARRYRSSSLGVLVTTASSRGSAAPAESRCTPLMTWKSIAE